MVLLSHAHDGAAGQFGCDMMYMPSHTSDGTAESCW
jgi:hypothetical protein